MKIDKYFKTLLSTIDKDNVLDDVRVSRNEIEKLVKPAYEQGAKLMGNWKFKSSEVKDLMSLFNRLARNRRGNLVTSIADALPTIIENIELAEDFVLRTYAETVATGGLTYQQAQLLQYVELTGFFSRYSRELLDYIYIHETAALEKDVPEEDSVRNDLNPVEIDYIKRGFQDFVNVFNALSTKQADTKKFLEEIPNIQITENNLGTLPVTAGEEKVDPFRLGFISANYNPIFHLRMVWEDWQISRYNLAERELIQLQNRKLNLEQVAANRPNAALQQRIGETNLHIKSLRAKLAKMERAHA